MNEISNTNAATMKDPTKMNLSFGDAIEAVKIGMLARRAGWNGKGMFIFQRPGDVISADVVVNKIQTIPQSAKNYFKKLLPQQYSDGETEMGVVEFAPYLCLKTPDDNVVNGWLASQTDLLANDLEVFNIE